MQTFFVVCLVILGIMNAVMFIYGGEMFSLMTKPHRLNTVKRITTPMREVDGMTMYTYAAYVNGKAAMDHELIIVNAIGGEGLKKDYNNGLINVLVYDNMFVRLVGVKTSEDAQKLDDTDAMKKAREEKYRVNTHFKIKGINESQDSRYLGFVKMKPMPADVFKTSGMFTFLGLYVDFSQQNL
jgi:hypothetical protein